MRIQLAPLVCFVLFATGKKEQKGKNAAPVCCARKILRLANAMNGCNRLRGISSTL